MKAFKTWLGTLLLISLLSCQKEMSEEHGVFNPGVLDMAWEFRQGENFYKGSFDTAYLQTQGSLEALTLEGTAEDGSGQIFMQLIGDPLIPGVYVGDQGVFQYSIDGAIAFVSTNGGLGNQFAITITYIDSARISANFSGVLFDSEGNPATVTDGRMSAEYSTEDGISPVEPGELVPTCDRIVVRGVYRKGEEMGAGNLVRIPVWVVTAGSWSVDTETDNGLRLFGEGEVTENDTEILVNVIGTPLEAIQAVLDLNMGPEFCKVVINVEGTEDPLVQGPVGSLRSQERINPDEERSLINYWGSGRKIGQIISDEDPMRKIYYNGNGKIDRIEYYTDLGMGNYRRDAAHRYRYKNDGHLFAILNMAEQPHLDTIMTYYWNAAGMISRRVEFASGSPVTVYDYSYTSGNITRISMSFSGIQRQWDLAYDGRSNRFPNMADQYYFLDPAVVFEGTPFMEAFYFSQNYPVSVTASGGSTESLDVMVNPNLVPVEIKRGGQSWYRFFYN